MGRIYSIRSFNNIESSDIRYIEAIYPDRFIGIGIKSSISHLLVGLLVSVIHHHFHSNLDIAGLNTDVLYWL